MKEAIKNILGRAGYSLTSKTLIPEKKRSVLFDLFFEQRDPFFVQIGASDGKRHDPIYPYVTKYGLSGVAIEPMVDGFKALQETYKDYPNVKCVNAAIGKETGTFTFYTVVDWFKKDPNAHTSVSSFDRATLRKNIAKSAKERGIQIVSPDDCIREVSVPTLRLSDLVDACEIKRIDFLQIDCEGYDYEILKTFDFERFSPRIINFESEHLSVDDTDECNELFTSKGYTLFNCRHDTCAYKI